MKRILIIYHDSRENIIEDYESYSQKPYLHELNFHSGADDRRISEQALAREIHRQHRHQGTAGEDYFSRRIYRVIEIARELSVELLD